MPTRPRDLNASDPVERFALALRDLHRQAGRPKQRILASSLHCSNATVSAILNGHRFPSWEQTQSFVTACGGDLAAWKQRWAQADREINRESHAPGIDGSVGESAVSPAAARDAASAVEHLSDSDFYRAMLVEVNRAKFRIMTTFIRHRPPAYFLEFADQQTASAAAAYFSGVVAWSGRPGRRSARRIISTANAEMVDWARQLARDTAHYPNHEIRTVEWPFASDAVNMAIYDDSVGFLAFTAGAVQQLDGFCTRDPDFVRSCVGYFEQLWAQARKMPPP